MRIDFHTHGKWSKHIAFSYSYYSEMMKQASRYLDAVALTEHFNTINFHHIFEVLDTEALYEEGYYVVEGVKVFPGIEVDVAEKSHILVIGGRESIRAISSQLDSFRASGDFMPLEQLIDLCDEHRCLKIGAHPYREENPLYQVDKSLLKRLDALDINGRDLHKYGLDMEHRVKQLADALELSAVAGSDTHQPLQFGCVTNVLDDECANAAELKEAIRRRQYRCTVSEDLHAKVSSAEEEQMKYKRGLLLR
ncbi:PHP-associated domain-containing protein [Paenibacillus puerhi]|uniref:PHP-associated domain-containing protein n=1 Tax=Paenibacillus puerhi TaxID=2692622 RepID=UPI001356EE13|nr:PHP-associated domain-containing protein [Paenibacillus puerhi]